MSNELKSIVERFEFSGGGLDKSNTPPVTDKTNSTQEQLEPKVDIEKNLINEVEGYVHKIEREEYSRLYKDLLGHKASEADLDSAMHLARTLRISDGDPLWPILLSQERLLGQQKVESEKLREAIQSSEKILENITKQANSIRSEIVFLPASVRKKTPVWLQTFFTLSVLKSGVIASALIISSYSLLVQSAPEKISQLNGGYDFLSTCLNGVGDIEKQGDKIICSFDSKTFSYLVKKDK